MVTKYINKKKFKIKKKWRFWRLFKTFFLKKKKKSNFFRIQWLLNQKRIIWHQLASMYGKKIKNLIYANHKTKRIFNSKFDNLLRVLELRLNILLVRINFFNKLLVSNQNILNSNILVNGNKKHPNYQVRIFDVISKETSGSVSLTSRVKNNSHAWKWRRFRRKYKKYFKRQLRRARRYRLYFLIKTNLVFNFMEINYFIFWGILVRYPLLGEIVYKNKKRFLFGGLLRKVHFLY